MYVPSGVFALHAQIAEDFITSHGRDTLLHYIKISPCSTCSTHHWTHGGKVPLAGICPNCGGSGTKSTTVTKTIKQAVYYEPKSWIKVNAVWNIESPANYIQSRTLYRYLSDILQCDYMMIDGVKYTLENRPSPHGMQQATELICLWKIA